MFSFNVLVAPVPESARTLGNSVAATEFVVYAEGDDVDVLGDCIGRCSSAGRHREGVVIVAHHQTVVFDTGRPVRREPIFKANADRGTQFMRRRVVQASSGSVLYQEI